MSAKPAGKALNTGRAQSGQVTLFTAESHKRVPFLSCTQSSENLDLRSLLAHFYYVSKTALYRSLYFYWIKR